MHTQILTSKFGAELVSFKLNGEERLHQGEEVIDKNGKGETDDGIKGGRCVQTRCIS